MLAEGSAIAPSAGGAAAPMPATAPDDPLRVTSACPAPPLPAPAADPPDPLEPLLSKAPGSGPDPDDGVAPPRGPPCYEAPVKIGTH